MPRNNMTVVTPAYDALQCKHHVEEGGGAQQLWAAATNGYRACCSKGGVVCTRSQGLAPNLQSPQLAQPLPQARYPAPSVLAGPAGHRGLQWQCPGGGVGWGETHLGGEGVEPRGICQGQSAFGCVAHWGKSKFGCACWDVMCCFLLTTRALCL